MYLLQLDSGYRILIDCGMDYEQKRNPIQADNLFPFDPATLHLVVLTHAHIDHSGNIPTLVNQGFRGHILCTPATAELTTHLLFDSANIQLNGYRKNLGNTRKTKREFIPKPLFSEQHVKQCTEHFFTLNFDCPIQINDHLEVILREAGHLLGAASVEFHVTEKGKTQVIGFSGDLGRKGSKLLKDGVCFEKVDFLISETTYGGRTHQVSRSAEDELLEYIKNTCLDFRGRLVIPAFSVGRTQAIVFTLHQLKQKGHLPGWLKVYVDSPLAAKSTPVYEKYAAILNEEARDFLEENGSLFQFEGIEFLKDKDDHKKLMSKYEPCIIVSAAGMVEGGRIQEHIINNIENPYSTILIAGFCADGTLGQRLLLGQSTIRIKGKDRMVYARVARTDVFSSHPDHSEILSYLTETVSKTQANGGNIKRIFLVHGEDPQLEAMQKEIRMTMDLDAVIPDPGAIFEL